MLYVRAYAENIFESFTLKSLADEVFYNIAIIDAVVTYFRQLVFGYARYYQCFNDWHKLCCFKDGARASATTFTTAAVHEHVICGQTKVLSMDGYPVELKSPNYPGLYPASTNCSIVLIAPEDMVISFNLFTIQVEVCCDYLQVSNTKCQFIQKILQLSLEITSLKDFHDTVRFCVKKMFILRQ